MTTRIQIGVFLTACLSFSSGTVDAQWYMSPQFGIGHQNGLGFAGGNPAFNTPGFKAGFGNNGVNGFGFPGYGNPGIAGGAGMNSSGFQPGAQGGGGSSDVGAGAGYSMVESTWSAELKGLAALVRSEGAYQMSTTKALINYEEARKKYIENEQRLVETRQTVRRLAAAEDAKNQDAVLATRDRADKFIESHRPQPLLYRQLDRTTGQIQWPAALLAKEYDDVRKTLDDLFAKHFKGSQTSESPNVTSEIRGKILEMRDILRSQIQSIPLADYSDARRFLDGLAVSVN